jgi:hypothetical protein
MPTVVCSELMSLVAKILTPLASECHFANVILYTSLKNGKTKKTSIIKN